MGTKLGMDIVRNVIKNSMEKNNKIMLMKEILMSVKQQPMGLPNTKVEIYKTSFMHI